MAIFFEKISIFVSDCEFSQLIYLRNKLWGEIFNLLGILLSHEGVRNVKVLEIISSTLSQNGNEIFLQSLCEAISSFNSSSKIKIFISFLYANAFSILNYIKKRKEVLPFFLYYIPSRYDLSGFI